ncbi:RICIN domain-containing protein [Streptomyces sp. NPDC087908]|uniref:RICIN domain-containing protein n=1 Tax=Streptomyces sp. NPDC087908 TaxID=3365820 RepID=UPI0038177AF4
MAQLNTPYELAVDCVDTLYIAGHNNHCIRKIATVRVDGQPESGTVVSWTNVRSRLRIGVHRKSFKDGGDILYRVENVGSGKVLEVTDAQETAGAPVTPGAYTGNTAHRQHWRLIPTDPATNSPTAYEIGNRKSGLLLHVATNAPRTAERGRRPSKPPLATPSPVTRHRRPTPTPHKSYPRIRGQKATRPSEPERPRKRRNPYRTAGSDIDTRSRFRGSWLRA